MCVSVAAFIFQYFIYICLFVYLFVSLFVSLHSSSLIAVSLSLSLSPPALFVCVNLPYLLQKNKCFFMPLISIIFYSFEAVISVAIVLLWLCYLVWRVVSSTIYLTNSSILLLFNNKIKTISDNIKWGAIKNRVLLFFLNKLNAHIKCKSILKGNNKKKKKIIKNKQTNERVFGLKRILHFEKLNE